MLHMDSLTCLTPEGRISSLHPTLTVSDYLVQKLLHKVRIGLCDSPDQNTRWLLIAEHIPHIDNAHFYNLSALQPPQNLGIHSTLSIIVQGIPNTLSVLPPSIFLYPCLNLYTLHTSGALITICLKVKMYQSIYYLILLTRIASSPSQLLV